MKKTALCYVYFLAVSFFLSGIQSSLYFLPFSMPYFWFIVLTYYSFNKNLIFCVTLNLLHLFVICQFSSISLFTLLINMNFISLAFILIRDRFHVGLLQISMSAGLGCFIFLLNGWFLNSLSHGFHIPQLLSWFGASIMTALFTPLLIPLLEFIDKKIHTERIDTLENLRI